MLKRACAIDRERMGVPLSTPAPISAQGGGEDTACGPLCFPLGKILYTPLGVLYVGENT